MVSDRKKESMVEKKNKRFMSTGVRQRRLASAMDINNELLPKSIKSMKRDSSVSSGYRTINEDYGWNSSAK